MSFPPTPSRRTLWLCAALLLLPACSDAANCPPDTPPAREFPELSAEAQWDSKLEDLVGFDYGEAWLTPYLVYGTNLALPGAMMLWLMISFLLLARKGAIATESEDAAKATGLKAGDTMLHGTVVLPDADGPLLKLIVEQAGVQFYRSSTNKKPNWKTRWTEIDRQLHAHPFTLRTAAGDVLIHADADALLLDKLETNKRDGALRTRVAEVHDGDDLYAMGRLVEGAAPKAGGYRGGARQWTLAPPSDGRMMLSTMPLDAAYKHHAANRIVGLVALAFLVVVAQLLAIPYHWAFVAANDEPAVVTTRCHYTTTVKNNTEDHFYTTYRLLSTGEDSTTRVNNGDYARMPVGTVVPVSVRRGGSEPRITLGSGATTNAGVSLVPMFFIVISVFLCPILIFRSRPWWERKKLVDVIDGTLESQP